MNYKEQLLSSGIQFVADKLLNQGKFKKPSIIDIYTGGGITGEGTGEKTTKGPTTLGGIAKQGILSILARSILGPILGPIALTLGTNFFNKKRQGLGFFEQPGSPTTQPEDVRGTFTATAPQFADVQDTLGSIDSGTDINYDTGDITDKATGITTGNVYDEVALTGGDSSDDGSNGGGGGNMDASDFSDDTAGTPFRYGGLASLYR